MYMMGFTMNNMTMLGLVVAVGIVIDDAIVMVEIYLPAPLLAAEVPCRQLRCFRGDWIAIISTTLVLGGVFLPVAFMGNDGKIILRIRHHLAFAIVCSSLVADRGSHAQFTLSDDPYTQMVSPANV